MNVELKIMNDCYSDWIPTFLPEVTEESFDIIAKNLKDTSAMLGMTIQK